MTTIHARSGKVLAAVLAAGLLGGALGHGSAEAQNRTEHIFDDWRVVCVDGAESEGEKRCHMVQTLVHNETRRELFRWMIVATQDGQLVNVFSAPLGVALRPGVQVTLGEQEPVTVGYNVCNQRWCHARQPMSDDLRARIASGESAQVSYVNRRGQGLRMQATLRGFEEALGFMEEQNAI